MVFFVSFFFSFFKEFLPKLCENVIEILDLLEILDIEILGLIFLWKMFVPCFPFVT